MTDQSRPVISSFTRIPEEFHSFETGKPFERCIDCGKHLLDDGTGYVVQKVIRGPEVMFELAQCLECHRQLFESYSSETRNRVYDFFLDRVNFDQRRRRLLKEAWTSLGPWIESCLFCGAARSETREYWLVGECDGRDMMFYRCPYIICETCILEKNKLLSAKSRDISNDWLGRHFDIPPSIQEEIPDGTMASVRDALSKAG